MDFRVYHLNKMTSFTYVCEAVFIWDKELWQTRNKQVFVGKIDPTTGRSSRPNGLILSRSRFVIRSVPLRPRQLGHFRARQLWRTQLLTLYHEIGIFGVASRTYDRCVFPCQPMRRIELWFFLGQEPSD